jgi:7tm Chemosensory receptor
MSSWLTQSSRDLRKLTSASSKLKTGHKYREPAQKTFPPLSRKKALTTVDVQKLATIHSQLTEVIELINQIYSVFVMLFFGGIFCLFNLFLFSLVITRDYYQNLTEAIMMTISNFQWNLYDVALVVLVIQATTAASGEGRRTMSLIYKIVNTAMDGKLNGQVR